MLDAELTWGIRNPLVQHEGVVAQYGMVNVYFQAPDCTNGWINNIGHKVSYVGDSEEQFEELKSFLNGGMIADSQLIFKYTFGLGENMSEPICLVDLGKYKFWVQRRFTSLLLTWTMTDQPLDFEKAIEVKQTVKMLKLREIVDPTVSLLRHREASEEARYLDSLWAES